MSPIKNVIYFIKKKECDINYDFEWNKMIKKNTCDFQLIC